MSNPAENIPELRKEIERLKESIDPSTLRRASELTMAEKFRLGADLFDEQMRWLKQIIQAERPEWNAEQIDAEIGRRKAIKRKVEEKGIFQPCVEERSVEI
ncbi:MAG: hypothetical protein ACK55S_17935 [Planctomycetota bacterium]|jgi:hypothetical protein